MNTLSQPKLMLDSLAALKRYMEPGAIVTLTHFAFNGQPARVRSDAKGTEP